MDINNTELEKSLIGGLLGNPSIAAELVETVKPDDFGHKGLGAIWQTITNHVEQGKPIDTVTVGSQHSEAIILMTDHLVSERGATNHMLREYASLVKRQSLRRSIMETASDITKAAVSNDKDEDVINHIQGLVMQYSANDSAYKPAKAKDILKECADQYFERIANGGKIAGLPSGLIDLDNRVFGYRPGDLVIIAGRPAMGKTNFGLNIASFNCKAGKHGLVFSLEMPKEQLVERLIADAGNCPYGGIRKGSQDITDQYTAGVGTVNDYNLTIYDKPAITPAELIGVARKELARNGKLDYILVDYLQLMSVSKSQNRTDEIGQISRALKRVAKEFECPVFALSQLNRSLEQRANKRPVMSDLRESGDIEQDADIIHFIYREEVYTKGKDEGIAEIITAKFRAGETGTDRVRTRFEYCRFEDLQGYEPPAFSEKHNGGFNG